MLQKIFQVGKTYAKFDVGENFLSWKSSNIKNDTGENFQIGKTYSKFGLGKIFLIGKTYTKFGIEKNFVYR